MIKPMLAKPFHPRHMTEDSVLQPKLNGMRLIWTGSKLLTRRGKPVVGVPHVEKALKSDFKNFPIDGELFVDPKDVGFSKLIGKLRRSKTLDPDPRIKFYAFDLPIRGKVFMDRYALLRKELDGSTEVIPVETRLELPGDVEKLLRDWRAGSKVQREHLFANLETVLNVYAGEHEGTMIRTLDSMYQFGKRSSDLMKLKTFKDSEFKVVGFAELESHEKVPVTPNTPGSHQRQDGSWVKNGKATPMKALGAFKCETPKTKLVFEVGSGLTAEMRKRYWKDKKNLLGKLVTVKYQVLLPSGKPQFPVFVEVRDYE